MVNPVPGHSVSTPYGRRGSYWSCYEDRNGDGLHTGNDYAAPIGTLVVAARPGRVVHANHGSAFGSHQVEVLPGDGTRDFYAHLSSRVPHGTRVRTGEPVGRIGAEGNVTGPHLHFERHAIATGGWSCSIIRDPQPSINYQTPDTEEDDMAYRDWPEADRKALANDVADAVWDQLMAVTTPSGDKELKTSARVIRETWSKLAKHMDKGG